MKAKILFIAVGLLYAIHSDAQTKLYTIHGKLQSMPVPPAKMYLSELQHIGILKNDIDSALVKDGEYEFKVQFNADEAVSVVIADKLKNAGRDNSFSVIIDHGDISLVSAGTISNYTAGGAGAATQEQFEAVNRNIKLKQDSLRAIMTTESYKTDDALKKKVQSELLDMLGQSVFNSYSYAKKNKDTRLSPYITYMLVQLPFLSISGKDTLVNGLPERVKADMLGKAITQSLAKQKFKADSLAKIQNEIQHEALAKMPVGSKARDFTQNDINGKPVSLASFKGKYVLIDFWASWCAPCRAENPNVVKAFNAYKNKGFTVLGVSLDGQSGKTAWLKAIEKDGLKWTQVSDLNGWKNSAADAYGVVAIPQNFLVDPNGIVIARNLRGEELTKKLSGIFK